MKGRSCSTKIPIFFFPAEGFPIAVSVCTGQATHCLASSFESVPQDHGHSHRQSWIQPLPVSSSVNRMAHPWDTVTQIVSLLPPGLSETTCQEHSSFWPWWFMLSGAGIDQQRVFNCAWVWRAKPQFISLPTSLKLGIGPRSWQWFILAQAAKDCTEKPGKSQREEDGGWVEKSRTPHLLQACWESQASAKNQAQAPAVPRTLLAFVF